MDNPLHLPEGFCFGVQPRWQHGDLGLMVGRVFDTIARGCHDITSAPSSYGAAANGIFEQASPTTKILRVALCGRNHSSSLLCAENERMVVVVGMFVVMVV